MAFGNCSCPLPAALTTIPPFSCGEDLGQIQKLVVQRFGNPFDDLTKPTLIANWTTLKTATDGTKVVTTPYVENFVIAQGAAITEGGNDNTTIDGIPIVVGAEAPVATGVFASLPSATLKALQTLNCEGNLSVYLINNSGRIIGYSPNGTKFEGFPIQSFFVGDSGNDGLNTRDKSPVQFGLKAGWRTEAVFVTPADFSALFDL